jgi:hypothetical protein
VNRAPLLCAAACCALMAGVLGGPRECPEPPVYDVDVAPILQAHCVSCHGDTNPAAGWSATSFLGVIACVPSNVPATLAARRCSAHPGGAADGAAPRAC